MIGQGTLALYSVTDKDSILYELESRDYEFQECIEKSFILSQRHSERH